MMNKKPKLRDYVLMREEEFGAILFDSVKGRMHQINKTGVFILQLCNGENTMETIAKELARSEKAPKKNVAKDTEEFLDDLFNRELIEWR
jgi:hypothetical protein